MPEAITKGPSRRPVLRFQTGDEVRAYRQKRGLNQMEFWSRVGVTQSGGSRYESGRSIPRPVQVLLHMTYGTDKQAESMLSWLRGHR
ncbi:helix-turn-helix domain-containing protein [Thauera phenylacetica]|uniref:helix-turn-helix domain-containing protein n=1 Tax=Thauera phenylacetica TaxID=164400 RepID=UPI0039E59CC2